MLTIYVTSRHGGIWVKLWTINSSSFLGWFGMVAREPDLLVACVALIALHPANIILGLSALSLLSRQSNLHICWTFVAINSSIKPNSDSSSQHANKKYKIWPFKERDLVFIHSSELLNKYEFLLNAK